MVLRCQLPQGNSQIVITKTQEFDYNAPRIEIFSLMICKSLSKLYSLDSEMEIQGQSMFLILLFV